MRTAASVLGEEALAAAVPLLQRVALVAGDPHRAAPATGNC